MFAYLVLFCSLCPLLIVERNGDKTFNKRFIRLHKSAYFINFELVPRKNWLLETNSLSDWAIVTQRGKVLICCTLAHRNTYVTLSPHQLAPLSSSLPPLFQCNAWASSKHSVLLRFFSLSLLLVFFSSLCPFFFGSCDLVAFLSVVSLCVCVCVQVYNPNTFCSSFFPSLCLFDYAIVSTLLLCTRTLSFHHVWFCVCLHA